jgi:hypothetical protein
MRTMIALLVLVPALAAADGHKHHRYIGIHPIAKSHGGGLCHIEGPHVHLFEADKIQYRDHHGAAYFVGDPVAYGWDGPKHAYKGHHPIHIHLVTGAPEPDVEYCYLDGPHFHQFTAPEGPDFKVVGDVTFFVGKPPKVYVDARPAYIGINAVYAPFAYVRPTVTVEAPVGWIGAHVDVVAPVVVAPSVKVVAPNVRAKVEVHLPPPPSVRVNIGVGVGVKVRGGAGVKVKHGKRKRRF